MMFNKTIFIHIALIIILPTVAAFSQTEKGLLIVEGNVSYSFSRNENNGLSILSPGEYRSLESRSLILGPKLGYFFADDLLVGMGLTYHNSREIEKGNANGGFFTKNTTRMFFLHPYLRKHIYIRKHLYFITTLNVMIGLGQEHRLSEVGIALPQERKYNLSEYQVNLSPGLLYVLSDRLNISGHFSSLFFTKLTTVDKENSDMRRTQQDYGISLGSETLALGLQYYLQKPGKSD